MFSVLLSTFLTSFSQQFTGTTGIQIVNDSPYDISYTASPIDASCQISTSTTPVIIPANSTVVTSYNQPAQFSFSNIRFRAEIPSGCTGVSTDFNAGNPCFCSPGNPSNGSFHLTTNNCGTYTFNVDWVRCTFNTPNSGPPIGTIALLIIS